MAATHFAQGTPKRGGILRISAPANPSSLDPATGGAGSDHAFLFTMYDTLTEWDFETLKPKPGLAESWNFTDSTTLVLNIRSGVTFHDGKALDAEAVKFNLERNKSDPKSNIKADLASMASAEVTGPMQVTLKLSAPALKLNARRQPNAKGQRALPTRPQRPERELNRRNPKLKEPKRMKGWHAKRQTAHVFKPQRRSVKGTRHAKLSTSRYQRFWKPDAKLAGWS